VHINYESNEESVENLRVSGKSLPLCFSSFQFLRENCKQVVSSRDGECSNESVEDVNDDMEVVLAPKLNPLSYFEFQIPDESLETETDELMSYNFVPLSFNLFPFLKENVANIFESRIGKPIENHVVTMESLQPMQQSFQFLQDPIVDVLDDLCSQSHVLFASCGLKRIYDIDKIRQSISWFVSAGASFQSSSENL